MDNNEGYKALQAVMFVNRFQGKPLSDLCFVLGIERKPYECVPFIGNYFLRKRVSAKYWAIHEGGTK